MYPRLVLAACLLVAAVVAAPVPRAKEVPPYIDLKGHANHHRMNDFGTGRYPGNHLGSLPAGKQTFAGVKFQVGDAMMQLASAYIKARPEKIEGIKVGRTLTRLHFLHGTGFSAAAGQVIAKYVVHYADRTTAEIAVKYGTDVVDWYAYPDQAAPTQGKMAWEGENEAAKKFDAKIRLYLMTWKNPHPKKKVVSIDFVATATATYATPFCVAISADDK